MSLFSSKENENDYMELTRRSSGVKHVRGIQTVNKVIMFSNRSMNTKNFGKFFFLIISEALKMNNTSPLTQIKLCYVSGHV